MKKTLLLLVAVFCFGFAQAQLQGGLKAGANFANVNAGDGYEPDGKTGYHFGLWARAGMAGLFIQPELLYSAKGTDDFDLTYIEVPILLSKNFAKIFNLHLGPQFGFLSKAEFGDEDIKEGLKGTDISAVIGLGLNLPGGLGAGGRYVYGLSDIDDNAFETEIKNRTVQLYLSYRLFGD